MKTLLAASMAAALGSLILLGGCGNPETVEDSYTTTSADPNTGILPSTTSIEPTTGEPASTTEYNRPDGPEEGFHTLVDAGGNVRQYRLTDLSSGENPPLLVVLHGFGGSSQQMREYLETEETIDLLAEHAPIVAYPDGIGYGGLPRAWNAGKCCPMASIDLVDDVGFISRMIDEIAEEQKIDTERVWVAGWSNGGMMAYRLACELSEKISAVIVGAGALMLESCVPSRPVNILHIHGEMDTAVPYNGGTNTGILFPSTRTSVDTIAKANDCEAGSSETAGTTTVLVMACPEGTRIQLVTDSTWIHVWEREWTELLVAFLRKP